MMLKVGDVLYGVYEGFGHLTMDTATVTKVTAQTVWISGGGNAFGFRTRLDHMNADRYDTTKEAALARYVQKCADRLEGAEAAFRRALKFQEEQQ